MIRGSLIIAVIAVGLSVLIHLLGLGLTFRVGGVDGGPPPTNDSVPVSTTFEDLAEDAAEPVEPEAAEEPEPPTETAVEPEEADVPVSQAQVASSNPQQVASPDVGEGEATEPELSEPVEPAQTQEPTDPGTNAEEDVTPPVDAADAVAAPPPPVETVAEAEDVQPEAAEAAEPVELAAVPPQAAETPVEQSDIPVVPIVPETEPTQEAEIAAPAPSEAAEDTTGTALAVARSIRPRTPSRPSDATPDRLFDSARNFDSLRFPEQAIESPLTTYRRKGVDAFASANTGSQTASRSGGNSTTTNYAGRVLIQLNSVPTIFVPGQGFAQVYIEINPDGSLGRVTIVDSSGSIKIDNAAGDQVRRAAPFPKPPDGKGRAVSFYYRVN